MKMVEKSGLTSSNVILEGFQDTGLVLFPAFESYDRNTHPVLQWSRE